MFLTDTKHLKEDAKFPSGLTESWIQLSTLGSRTRDCCSVRPFAQKHMTISVGKCEPSWVQSFSGKLLPSSSIQLPVLLSLETEVFRLQGFVLELVTSRPSAFLPFTSVVRLNDRNVFSRVWATYSENLSLSKLSPVSVCIFCCSLYVMCWSQWVMLCLYCSLQICF